MSAEWYVRQMKEKVNEAYTLPISMKDSQFVQSTRDFIRYTDYKIPGNVELENVMGILLSDNPQDQQQMQDGSYNNFLPTKNFKLTINKQAVVENNVRSEEHTSELQSIMRISYDVFCLKKKKKKQQQNKNIDI